MNKNRVTRSIQKPLIACGVALCAMLFSLSASAQSNTYEDFGNYRVYFSVFNSTFLTPEVAELYGFTRSGSRALINISLVHRSEDGDSLGLPASVEGAAQNLIMQSTPLNFTEIHDGDAVYYMAGFRFNNEEPLHFTIEVDHSGTASPHEVTFTKTLYRD